MYIVVWYNYIRMYCIVKKEMPSQMITMIIFKLGLEDFCVAGGRDACSAGFPLPIVS